MTSESDNILLFRTDIKTRKDQRWLKQVLADLPIERWSVDSEDRDCVLRVVSPTLCAEDIIRVVAQSGHLCTELA